jgi:hypothetical protein
MRVEGCAISASALQQLELLSELLLAFYVPKDDAPTTSVDTTNAAVFMVMVSVHCVLQPLFLSSCSLSEDLEIPKVTYYMILRHGNLECEALNATLN